jgi:hypothetical protein
MTDLRPAGEVGGDDVSMTGSRVGFTGTRHGMTPDQRGTVAFQMTLMDVSEVHHGDCVGADAEFHDLCHGVWPVIIHPPLDPKLRAWCDGDVLPEKPYLDRNRDIVEACDVLIATPQSLTEGKGGTWYTINRAVDAGKEVRVIGPDGQTWSP